MNVKLLAAIAIIALPLSVDARIIGANKTPEPQAAAAPEGTRLLDTQKGKVVSDGGEIKDSTGYFDLQKKKFGKLWDGALKYQEDSCRLATVAYRGSSSEIEVFWKDAPAVTCFQKLDLDWAKLKKPELVRITRADSIWATDQGIKVGTTLEELEKLNDGSVGFIGMGWPLGGACCMGKAFSKHVGVTLAIDDKVKEGNPDAFKYYEENLTGDQRIESKDIPADIKKELNIRVKELYLNF